MARLEQHPLAKKYTPAPTEDQINEMKKSIEDRGLSHFYPIITYEGKVLVGYTRYLACLSLKITPEWQPYEGTEPVGFIMLSEISRRKMSIVQAIRLAESMRPELEREAQKRRVSGGVGAPVHQGVTTGRVNEKIAEVAGVSQRTAANYHKVQVDGTTALKDAVDSEAISIKDAAAVADEPAAVQDAVVKVVKSGKAKTAKEAVEQITEREPGDDTEAIEAEKKTASAAARRSGKPTFDNRIIEDAFGSLIRSLSKREDVWGKHHRLEKCREHLHDAYEVLERMEDGVVMNPAWPHQIRSVHMIEDAIKEGQRRILFTAPTGAGKTRVTTDLIRRWLADGLRTVLYTNRKLLIEQTARVMEESGITHGVRASGWDENLGRDVQVSSIQTEHSRVLRSGEWPLHNAQRVIIDEAHIQKAAVARHILGMHLADGAVYVGLTATPIGLKDVYDVLLVGANMRELRECGALVLAKHYGPDEPDTRHIKKQATGEYSEGDVRRVIMTSTIFARVLEWYEKLNPEHKPSILFAPDVAGSVWFAEEFSKVGIEAAHIDGEECWLRGEMYRSNREIRKDILAGSKDGTIKLICNRFVMREGIDCPWLEHAIMATVFGTSHGFIQSGGRLLRASPGKEFAIIQDHGGNWWRHGSLNVDRHWELTYTANMVDGLRDASLRSKNDPEPIRCPQCSAIRIWRGARCPGCGFEIHDPTKKSRPVVQVDGTLKEHTGDIFKPRRVAMKPDTERIWEQCYYRCKKKKRTFRQAEGLFFYENHYFPPRTLRLMPLNDVDWFERVEKVPMERLRA